MGWVKRDGAAVLEVGTTESKPALRIVHEGNLGNAIEIVKPDGTALWTVDRTGRASLSELKMSNDGPVRSALVDLTKLNVTDTGSALGITTGYTGNDIVEPSILYDASAPFLGYEYVLCAAAYANSDATFENPSLWVSHDGNTWVPLVNGVPTPGGVVTPIVPHGVQGDGNNSDPYLVRGPDGTYYILWNQFLNSTASGGTGTNGHNWAIKGISAPSLAGPWSAPVTMVATDQAARRDASPSALWDGNQWHIYGIEYHDLNSPAVFHYTAPSLLGTWTLQTAPVIAMPAAYSGRGWWHLNAYRWGTRHFLLIQDNVLNTSGAGNIWHVWSDDGGTTWTVPSDPITKGSWYRSAAIVTDRGRSLGLDLYLGFLGSNWQLYRASATLEPLLYGGLGVDGVPQEAKVLSAARVPVAPYVFGDTCKRADNAASPGTADSGQVYTVQNGTVGISSNQLYGPGASNDKAVISTGLSDGVFTAEFSVIDRATAQMYLMFRVVDGNNFLRFGYQVNGPYHLDSIVSAAIAQTINSSLVPANGDWITVVCKGSSIAIYVNGVRLTSATWTDNQAGTSMGPQFSAPSNNRMRNLSARPLINGA